MEFLSFKIFYAYNVTGRAEITVAHWSNLNYNIPVLIGCYNNI